MCIILREDGGSDQGSQSNKREKNGIHVGRWMIISLKKELSRLYDYLVLSSALFIISIYIGFTIYVVSPTDVSELTEPFKGLVELFKRLTPLQRVLLVFINNSLKGFLNILFGPILGIYPLIFIVLNGIVIGFSFAVVAATDNLIYAILGMAPHGILEVPAMIICNALGFKLAFTAIKSIFGQNSLRKEIKTSLKIYVNISLPMLLAAAFIEIYITPRIVGVTF